MESRKKVIIMGIVSSVLLLCIFGFFIVRELRQYTSDKFVIVLDAGHGGDDTGACDLKASCTEKEINLGVVLACKEELEKYKGVKVVLTRGDDSNVSLDDRCFIGKKKKADIFISFHQNASAKHNKHGSEVYVSHSKFKKSFNEDSTRLGEQILSELSKLGYENDGVKTRLSDDTDFTFENDRADYYHVIRESVEYGFPGIIIEHGYMDNASDFAKMNSKEKWDKMGASDAFAIARFYNLELK